MMNLKWVLLIIRWGWSFGLGGLTKRSGMLHCGICTRSVALITPQFLIQKKCTLNCYR